jgi:DNA modification methylase
MTRHFKPAGLQTVIQLPLLDALEQKGGAGRPRDIYDRVAEALNVDPAAREATKACGDGQSYKIFEQQVRWARQTAVMHGLIAGERGRWELTDAGYTKLGKIRRGKVVLIYSLDDGLALWAHAEDAASYIEPGSVRLVMTSPPYPVVKRAYGRYSVPEWLDWMKRLMAIWKELIADDGTIAVNLMDVFERGSPALSPYVERFTLSTIDEVGLHLAGRMPWVSPSKFGNIQWSAKAKHAPKNQLEHILLFSRAPMPSWDVTRMDPPAPRATAKRRPRGMEVRPTGKVIRSDSFGNGPGLPSNVIISGGASGNDRYSRRCREEGVNAHPARYPTTVPRQVILLTTDLGEVVYDPLAGSNTTGQVALELGRRFISSDAMLQYVGSSAFRFDNRSDFRRYQHV